MMPIKHLEFNVQIHGLDMKSIDGIKFLEGWMKESIKAALNGNNRELFGFRDDSGDVEVLLSNSAGKVDEPVNGVFDE